MDWGTVRRSPLGGGKVNGTDGAGYVPSLSRPGRGFP